MFNQHNTIMAKLSMRKFNELPQGTPIKIEDVPKGGLIVRKPDAKTIHVNEGWDRYNRKYEISLFEDVCTVQLKKKGTIVYTVDC